MLGFMRHALTLAEGARGQLALLVRLHWIAGRRAAALMSAGPFAAVVVLTRRIQWFDMGDRTNHAQHHHAWVVFDYGRAEHSPRPSSSPHKTRCFAVTLDHGLAPPSRS